MDNLTNERFDWPNRVRPFSIPGLSSCLEDGRLTLDGVRVDTSWIDVYAMRLVEWAIGRGQSLILVPPEPFGALAALTAAAAHIASIVTQYSGSGKPMGSDLRVAVVTSNFRLRGLYRRLGIGHAKLFDVVPAATLSRSGEVSILGGDTGRGWSTIFLSRPSEIRQLERVDLAVIELPVDGQSEVGALDVPAVLIAHDPSDQLVVRLASDLPVFAWDDRDLRELPAIAINGGTALSEERLRLERVAAGLTCTPIPVLHPGICENAALFWQDIGPLLRAGNRSLFAKELAATAFVLFYDLMHLALPTDAYEAASRPLRVRLNEIASAQRLTKGDLRDLYIPMVTEELSGLAAAIGAESPKSAVLNAVLAERVASGQRVLLVTRTAELARAYGSYLNTFPTLRDAVVVSSLWGLATQRPTDVAVLIGLLPTSARYLYTTGIAAEILVLAYDTDSTTQPIAGGFTELAQVRAAIAYQQEYAGWLARGAAKAACWEVLSGEASDIVDDRPTPPRVDPSRIAVATLPPPPDIPPGLWDGSLGSLADLEGRLRRDLPTRITQGEADEVEVDAVRVEFDDDRWVLLERKGVVTRYRSSTGTPEAGCLVARVSSGDQLVFLDGEARKDLLAKVLEVAAELPELAVPAAWIDYWRQALRRAYATHGTYERLRSELTRRGCVRETQTVRLWVVGATIGPEDPEDIRRVGECIDDTALVSQYETIDRAIEALRNAHRALGQRLGAMARRVGPATAAGAIGADEIIDASTGLTASDFRDSIDILTVRRVTDAGRVPYAVTGHLRAAHEREVDIV